MREYWKGNFTALTPPSNKRDEIVAYTLHLPCEDRGVILVFRREEAAASFVIKLSDVRPDTEYTLKLSDEDYATTEMTVDGKSLIEGLSVNIEKAPGSLLIFYKAENID